MDLPNHALKIGFICTTRVTYAIKHFEKSNMANVGRSNSIYSPQCCSTVKCYSFLQSLSFFFLNLNLVFYLKPYILLIIVNNLDEDLFQ